MKRIPLKTLLKAQKKLAAKSTSSRKASTSAAEDAEVPAKQRKGRLAPRRDMAPDLLKSKAEVDEAKNRHKPRVRQSRDNKHAPTEMSSKRAVSRNRTVVDVTTIKRRDPRFDNLSGAFDATTFKNSYGFLDQARREEIKDLKTTLAVTKRKAGAVDQNKRAEMADQLSRLQSRQALVDKEEREKRAVGQWRSQEQEKQSQGKRPFFLKEDQRRKLVEDKRMQELSRNKRKLRKVMDKKKSAEKKRDFKSAPPLRQG